MRSSSSLSSTSGFSFEEVRDHFFPSFAERNSFYFTVMISLCPDGEKPYIGAFKSLATTLNNKESINNIVHAFRDGSELRNISLTVVSRIVTAIKTPANFKHVSSFLSWLSDHPLIAKDFLVSENLLIDAVKQENIFVLERLMGKNIRLFKMYILRYLFNEHNHHSFDVPLISVHYYRDPLSSKLLSLLRLIENFDVKTVFDKKDYRLPEGYGSQDVSADLFNVIMRILFWLDAASSSELIDEKIEHNALMALYNFLSSDPRDTLNELWKYPDLDSAMQDILRICLSLPSPDALTEEQIDSFFNYGNQKTPVVPVSSSLTISSTHFGSSSQKRKAEFASDDERAAKMQKTDETGFNASLK